MAEVVRITEEARNASINYNIEIVEELLKINKQLRDYDFSGIVKVKNTKHTIFRKHCKHDYRVFFQYSDKFLDLLLVDRKDENTYSRVRKMNRIFTDEVLKTNIDELINTEDVEAVHFIPETTDQGLIENTKVYEIKEQYLKTPDDLQILLREKYLFYSVKTKEQMEHISEITNKDERQVWIFQGAAGSGKTTCAVEIGRKFLEIYQRNTFLLVPTKELRKWCLTHFTLLNLNSKIIEVTKQTDVFQELSEQPKLFIATHDDFFYNLLGNDRNKFQPDEIKKKMGKFINNEIENWKYKELKEYSLDQIYAIIVNFIRPMQKMPTKDLVLLENESLYKLLEKLDFQKCYIQIKKDLFDHYDLFENIYKNRSVIEALIKEHNVNMIVDETQDLPIYLIKHIIDFFFCQNPRNFYKKLVFLADMNQKININDFKLGKICSEINKKKLIIEKGMLLNNYRNSPQIAQLAEKIITDIYKDFVESSETSKPMNPASKKNYSKAGDLPVIVVVSPEELCKKINRIINENKNEFGHFYQFVIATENRPQLEKYLTEESLSKISFFSPEDIKGLEFDSVVLFNLFPNPDQKRAIDVYRLYTSLTRSRYSVLIAMDQKTYGQNKQRLENRNELIIIQKPEDVILKKLLMENGRNLINQKQMTKSIIGDIANLKNRNGYQIKKIIEKTNLLANHGADMEELFEIIYLLVEKLTHLGMMNDEIKHLLNNSSKRIMGLYHESILEIRQAIALFDYASDRMYVERCIKKYSNDLNTLDLFRIYNTLKSPVDLIEYREKWNNSEDSYLYICNLARDNDLDHIGFIRNTINHHLEKSEIKINEMVSQIEEALSIIKGDNK